MYNRDNPAWHKEEIDLLKKEYKQNLGVYRLFPNRSINSVNHKASRLGLHRYMRSRKYSADHNFFKTWSPRMAYILGWFFSDGNVSYDKKQVSIHLNKNDQPILIKIRNIMKSNCPVPIYSDSAYLRIHSRVLAEDLIKKGCTPRKSKTLVFPKIENKFLSHFIRGYFDGDGSIYFNKPNTIKICFVGTKKFLSELQFRINKLLHTKKHPITNVKSLYRVQYYGDDARKLCNWIYKESKGLYLKRKRLRFKRHMELRL